jgi:SNF2 family DNA or RNA helicase
MKRIWHDYSLSIVLGFLFLATWIGQFLVQMPEFVQEQHQHGEPFMWGSFLITFWRATLENWQSEFLQLLSFVTLSAIFIHKGSAESKDSDEEMAAALERIERRLDALSPRGRLIKDEGS